MNTKIAQLFTLGSGLTLRGWSNSTATPTVLALHGWLDNADSFVPLHQQLPMLDWLALDLAGHGHSDHRSEGSAYHFVDYVADIVSLIRQQQWPPLILVGHSMGGMIASAIAAAFPELVAQLVLIDSLGLMTTEPVDATNQLRRGILSREGRAAKQMPCYASLEDAAHARWRQSDFDLHTATKLSERATIRHANGWQWRSDIRLRETSALRFTQAQAKQLMQDIRCPVLLLLAEQGLPLIQQAKQLYLPLLNNVTVVEVEGGHHCHMTNPVVCANAMKAFIGRARA